MPAGRSRKARIARRRKRRMDSVTHDLKHGDYKQSFQLSRDGLISNTPKVPV